MADLAASDVTYAEQFSWHTSGGKAVVCKLTFGDGSLTYPSGGVPITAASMGFPQGIKGFAIMEGSSGVTTLWKYDASANTLRAYTASGTSAELTGGATAVAAQEIWVLAFGQ